MFFVLCAVFGFCVGFVSGLIGIGGGTMLVPLFMYAFKMDIYKAVGTSLAIIGPVSLVGAYSHHLKGNVQLAPVLFVGAAAAIGIFAGGQMIHHVPEIALKRGFAVFLIFLAVKMMWK